MKRIRLDRWATQLQPPRNPRLHLRQQRCPFSHETQSAPRRQLQQRQYQVQHQWHCQRRYAGSRRKASSAAAVAEEVEEYEHGQPHAEHNRPSLDSEKIPLNAPPVHLATRSAKLAALHARLSLPSQLPLQTLARCLIDPSVDPRPGYNNGPFAVLGQDLLGYYTAEWLLCRYPRLPVPVIFAAQYAYVGAETLAAMRSEWGVEVVAAPGQEVDPGLLQLKKVMPEDSLADNGQMRLKDMPLARRLGTGRQNEKWNYRRGMSSRMVFDDQFGDLQSVDTAPYPGATTSTASNANREGSAQQLPVTTTTSRPPTPDGTEATTVESASASFIRALAGALYLHAGTAAAKSFHKDHVLSRHLALHTLFSFTHPTRDLSRLCAREGFEPPVARLLSETGRLSRTPVFVVGVYSGDDKLGEGAGSSLNEGRVRAAAAALRSWYLYSPPESEVMFPSDVEGAGKERERRRWKPQAIDVGEIVT